MRQPAAPAALKVTQPVHQQQPKVSPSVHRPAAPPGHHVGDHHHTVNNNDNARLQIEIDNLQELVQQQATQVAGLEKERDFYYQKLRNVEMICQDSECETQPHVQRILEILYATEEGFAQPDQENGNGELDDANGLTLGGTSAPIGGDDDTY